MAHASQVDIADLLLAVMRLSTSFRWWISYS